MGARMPRRVGWIWWVAAACGVANGLRLRQRATALDDIVVAGPDRAAEGGTGDPAVLESDRSWRTVIAAGRALPGEVETRIRRYAVGNDLDVVDVVPRRLPLEQALAFLRRADVGHLRDAPFSPAASARRSFVVAGSVADRAEIASAGSPLDMEVIAGELKKCAPYSFGHVVADVEPVEETPVDTAAVTLHQSKRFWPLVSGSQVAGYGFIALGFAVAPLAAAVALASWMLQPVVALAGTSLRPPRLAVHALLRVLTGPLGTWRALRETLRLARARSAEEPARQPVLEPRQPVFEPRMDRCPACGGIDLRHWVTGADMVQAKPGRFDLDRCTGCGLVFQNPRLTPESLMYYYEGYYEGAGEDEIDIVFGIAESVYRQRAELVPIDENPARWLDIGGAHGHFCLVARRRFPEATFSVVDQSPAVKDAERRGWIDTAHVGVAADFADQLGGTFDVVSSFHCIEHAVDPAEELRCAAAMLRAGGLLVVEVPNPESKFGRLLGRFWMPWLQPQHLNLLPRESMVELVESTGFDVLDDVPLARGIGDLVAAVFLLSRNLVARRVADGASESRSRVIARRAVTGALLPLYAPALLLDLAARALPLEWRADAYTVVARKRGERP